MQGCFEQQAKQTLRYIAKTRFDQNCPFTNLYVTFKNAFHLFHNLFTQVELGPIIAQNVLKDVETEKSFMSKLGDFINLIVEKFTKW